MLESCGTNCGWIAAFISCISFGSFAVPIKSKSSQTVDIDPLVFQSYKTIMCFLTSWLVLPLGQPFYFTPWGIVSGIFWVPAGVAAIYAVKKAGLAVSQGLWSSVIVLVSFTWGIAVFDEKVKSKFFAFLSICLMMIGLWGMSYFSVPDKQFKQKYSPSNSPEIINENGRVYNDDDMWRQKDERNALEIDNIDNNLHPYNRHDISFCESDDIIPSSYTSQQQQQHEQDETEIIYTFGNQPISQRKAGLLGALFNGIWGGSIMVPMHYAPAECKGMGYVISFAIGASIITLLLWVIRYFYIVLFNYRGQNSLDHQYSKWQGAYLDLPSFHLHVMWLPGMIAGLLWSVGNIASMISVQHLGEGVGYSLSQAAMLVSGLWGVFYYKEVEGTTVLKWFAAAFITIVGILCLSFEHVA